MVWQEKEDGSIWPFLCLHFGFLISLQLFLIGTQAAEALGLGSKSVWNNHRSVYK